MIFSLEQGFKTLWDRFIIPVDDPGSRLFHLNILMSLALVVLFYILQGVKTHHGLWVRLRQDVFRKKYWWNRSTIVDYKIYFLNSLLKVFLFIPFLDVSYGLATKTARFLVDRNQGDFLSLPVSTLSLGGFTIAVFIFDDFVRFFVHWLSHRWQWLWKLHSVHHSARVLTPITLFRSHPLESAISTIRNSFVMGLSTGVFIFVFEAPMSVFTLLGINVFGFVFNLLGSNLRHSQIPLSFGILERIFISPKMHQIHHSRDKNHWDMNMGVSLSIWDRMFGTVKYSKEVPEKIRFGL